MYRKFESKLDKLRKGLMKNVDDKIQSLRDEISMDLGVETRQSMKSWQLSSQYRHV